MSGQKIRQKPCTKYLGALIDQPLICKYQINFLKQKLNRANGILAKLRHHLLSDILKTVVMHVRSGLGENNSDILVMVQGAQNKALRIINFKEERHPAKCTSIPRYLILLI